jgi:acyl carrier protein
MASPLEAALAGLWAAALQVKTVRRDHDFLTLGGDSLGFTSLLTSVNALFGVSLKIALLSGDDATVAGMAQVIEADQSRAAADEQSTHGPQGLRVVDGSG